MARYAIIDSTTNLVVNVIMWEPESVEGQGYHPPEGTIAVESDTANIDDTYESDGSFTPHPLPPQPPV